MNSEMENSRLEPLSVLLKMMALAGVVIGVISLVIWTLLFGANVVVVLPVIIRAAAQDLEVNHSILVPFLLSPLGILRAVLLLLAARALLKEKSSAPRWALLYGIVALVTVPVDTYLLYSYGFMTVSTDAGALAYAVVRLLLPLGFIAYGISKRSLTRPVG